MRHVLSGLDIDIIEAASGNDALALCLEHEFALILLDVQMPGMDGVEVAQLLNGEETTRDTAIIFVTAGSVDDMDRLKGYDVGAIDYIVKPLNARLLAAKVRNIVELYRNRRALEKALADLDTTNRLLRTEINERKRAQARAQKLATHDALTGLPNRLLFLDRLTNTLQRAKRGQTMFALGYMDFDDFKPINDAYGHRAGDTVLETVAARLGEITRAADTTARLGGDEFALIFENITDTGSCLARCRSLREALSAPMTIPSANCAVELKIGVSIGLAFYPEHGSDPDWLMHNADCALYAVKRNGKAGVRIFCLGDERDPRYIRDSAGVG